MKNVKTLLIFIIVSTFLLASAQRVNSLGGNVGYWADDDNSWTAFPHTINNSNLAQVSGLGADGSHNAIVRWGEGTKWGFSWNEAATSDMLNLQWGNGSMGATFGLAMSANDDGDDTNGKATSSMGLSATWGQEMGFGDLGVGFSNGTYDDGDDATADDPSSMGLWLNLRRAQNVWLFDNMLVNFVYGSDNDPNGTMAGSADAQGVMGLHVNLYTHINISDNTTGLVAMGLAYDAVTNVGGTKDATSTSIGLPMWTFAVESAMTDWATCRLGLNTGYLLSGSTNDGGTDSKDATSQGGVDPSFSVGLGFNYGSFNLDVDVSEGLFTNPVQHVVGYESIAPAGATATLTYTW